MEERRGRPSIFVVALISFFFASVLFFLISPRVSPANRTSVLSEFFFYVFVFGRHAESDERFLLPTGSGFAADFHEQMGKSSYRVPAKVDEAYST